MADERVTNLAAKYGLTYEAAEEFIRDVFALGRVGDWDLTTPRYRLVERIRFDLLGAGPKEVKIEESPSGGFAVAGPGGHEFLVAVEKAVELRRMLESGEAEFVCGDEER